MLGQDLADPPDPQNVGISIRSGESKPLREMRTNDIAIQYFDIGETLRE